MESNLITYKPDSSIQIDVRVEDDTVWLTQLQMSQLFHTTRNNITLHIGNIFKEGELIKEEVCKESLQTTHHGAIKEKLQTNKVLIYNLDVIISVGYRVKSIQGTYFRQWANKVIKDYLLKGYAISQRFERIEKKLYEHEEKIEVLVQSALPPSEGLFFDGQIYDAYEFVRKIIKSAKRRIILIDNYIDESTLSIVKEKGSNIEVVIYTNNISESLSLSVNKFNKQYKNLSLKKFNLSHDRFLIIDENELFLFGASIKDLGKKWFGVAKMDSSNIKSILSKLP